MGFEITTNNSYRYHGMGASFIIIIIIFIGRQHAYIINEYVIQKKRYRQDRKQKVYQMYHMTSLSLAYPNASFNVVFESKCKTDLSVLSTTDTL